MSSVDYEGSPRAATPENFTADDGELLPTDEVPDSSSPTEETVPGIDLTGATISHEWSALPTYSDGAKSKLLNQLIQLKYRKCYKKGGDFLF
jgi:hypothetical protein